MAIAFIPEPKQLSPGRGHFQLPVRPVIAIHDHTCAAAAEEVRGILGPKAAMYAAVPEAPAAVSLRIVTIGHLQGYRLAINADGAAITGNDLDGLHYGVQTLRQIVAQSPGGKLPHLEITDWPDLAQRGLYYDICRGRVPKRERLIQLIDQLAQYKMNHFQLYIEHTFQFRRHPDIGKGASPLSPDDILALDAHCRARRIEMVPSLASFGHLGPVLKHPQYHHLAEDWGVNKYVDPTVLNDPHIRRLRAWSLSPANPEVYTFLDELFAEFLPLFSSDRFNVCCDETWTLGLGQSHALCEKIGKGRVYLNHLLRLRELAAKYGKRIMFWGDIIRSHPELISEIPSDVTVLDWGYDAETPFEAIRDFKKAGVPFHACPGTSGWVSLFPRLHESRANIAGFSAAAKKYGAEGLLNTDWGDGGHQNFMEYSWYGYLFGAEQGWNTTADQKSFTERFCRVFLNATDQKLVRAIGELGDITHTRVMPHYQSVWRHIIFSRPGEAVFTLGVGDAFISRNGKLARRRLRLDAAFGAKTLDRLDALRPVIAAHVGKTGEDPLGVLSYWLFALDTLRHAARKLTVLGPDGSDTASARKALHREMRQLQQRLEKLWAARNRPSEIRITLGLYRNVLKALEQKL
jgi:hypothetical protein